MSKKPATYAKKIAVSSLENLSENLPERLEELEESWKDKKVNVFISDREKIKVNDEFVLMFVNNVYEITKHITQREFRVLICLIKFSQYQNVFKITQKTIAIDTGYAQPHIAVILKKLRGNGYIIRDEENEIEYINPALFWKGGITQLKASELYKNLKDEHDENKQWKLPV